MLSAITDAIADYARSQQGIGKLLYRIKSVKTGHQDPFSIRGTDMPCLVVSQGPLGFVNPRANEIRVTGDTVKLSIYTSNADNISNAEREVQDIILGKDAETGLLKAMLLKRGYQVQVGDVIIPVTVALQALGAHENHIQFVYGKGEAGYIYGASFSVTAVTSIVLS